MHCLSRPQPTIWPRVCDPAVVWTLKDLSNTTWPINLRLPEWIGDRGRVWRCVWTVRHALLEKKTSVREMQRSHGSGYSSGYGKRSRDSYRETRTVRGRRGLSGEIGCQAAWFVSRLGSCQHNNLPAFLSFLFTSSVLTHTHARVSIPTAVVEFHTENTTAERMNWFADLQ